MSPVVERYVFVKLLPAHATPAGRDEVAARARAIGAVAGTPADEAAEKSWDVSVVLRADTREALAARLADAAVRAFFDDYLPERAQVVKNWSFVVS